MIATLDLITQYKISYIIISDTTMNENITWYDYGWAMNCFFKDKAFDMITNVAGKDCGRTCENTLGCTHFQIKPRMNDS